MQRASLDTLKAADAHASLEIIKMVLSNKPGAARDIVCLNAGAAIYVSGIVNTLAEGVEKAKTVIANGSALHKMDALVKYSKSFQ